MYIIYIEPLCFKSYKNAETNKVSEELKHFQNSLGFLFQKSTINSLFQIILLSFRDSQKRYESDRYVKPAAT